MGGCLCFGKKKSGKRKNTIQGEQALETKDIEATNPSGTVQKFQFLPEEHNTRSLLNKNIDKVFQVSEKIEESPHKTEEEVRQYIEKSKEKQQPTPTGSTKSLIRKHIKNSSNEKQDQKLQNLDKARKIIPTIHNKERKISINACKRSQFFIFDTSQVINIENCSDTLIFCGPCSGKISITNCKEMKLVLISSKIEIRRSKYCEISLFCCNPPTLIDSNEICFSNFLRIGYFQMMQQFSKCDLQVWNNRFLQVDDLDQNPDEQHYFQKKLHLFDIQWQKVLEQGQIQTADPIIPMFWGDLKLKKKKRIFVMNQPMRQIQLKLLKYIVSNNISIHKAFKGILNNKTYNKMKKLFPNHEENRYLCLIIGKELETSGFEAYFERIDGASAEEMEKEIFPYVYKED